MMVVAKLSEQSDEATIRVLAANLSLARALNPAVADIHDPATRLVLLVAALDMPPLCDSRLEGGGFGAPSCVENLCIRRQRTGICGDVSPVLVEDILRDT
jgi:hypothetical protein